MYIYGIYYYCEQQATVGISSYKPSNHGLVGLETDLGRSSAGSGQEGPQRRVRIRQDQEAGMLMQLVVKLSLSSAQAVRVLKSCTIDVYRLSSAECFVAKAMEALIQFMPASNSHEDKAIQMEEIGLPRHISSTPQRRHSCRN